MDEKIKYSKDVDILTIEFSEKPIEYAEEKGNFIIHSSKDGDIVLLEILNAKDFLLTSTAAILKESEEILIE